MTDNPNLLAEYVQTGSDATFRELVTRYVDLVYSTALRMVAGDTHRAEDVAQTVFLDLARVARTLPRDVKLGGWLHRDTCFVAANLMRGERRRQSRERQAVEMNALQNNSEADFSLVAPILDEAINELGEADRTAILLRFFEQHDFRAVGQALGSNEDAARMRVTRALEKLETFLKRRGVTTTAVSLGVVLTGNAVQAAPVGLAVTISTTAALAGTTLAVTATATAIKTIAMTTLQKTFVTATLVVVAGVGIYEARQAARQRDENQTLQRQYAPLNEQVRQLQRGYDDATSKLASLREDHERLARNTAELLKLRGEANRLRQQLAATTPIKPSSVEQTTPQQEAEQPPEAVQIFVANADANVPDGGTLAFGGWTTNPGKRMLLFVEPKIMKRSSPGRVGEVFLQGNFIEVPEEVLAKVAADLDLSFLEKLKATGKASSTQKVLTSEQAGLVLEALKRSPGVDVLSAPRITTGDGGQATVMVADKTVVAGREYMLGPSLDVEPRIAADGSSVNLTVSARLRKANPNQ